MPSISHVELDGMVLMAGPLEPRRCTEHGPGVPGRQAFEQAQDEARQQGS